MILHVLTCLTLLVAWPATGDATASAPASRPTSTRPTASQPVVRIRTYTPGETVTIDGISYAIDACDYRPKGNPLGSLTAAPKSNGKKPSKANAENDLKPGTPVEITVRMFVTSATSAAAKLQIGTIPLEDTNRNVFRAQPPWSQQTMTLPAGASQQAHLVYRLPGMRQLRLCLTASDGTKHLLVLPPPKREVTPPVRSGS